MRQPQTLNINALSFYLLPHELVIRLVDQNIPDIVLPNPFLQPLSTQKSPDLFYSFCLWLGKHIEVIALMG